MAAVIALLLLVPGSVIVMAALAIAWTGLFVCLHVIGELVLLIGTHLRARAHRPHAPRRHHRSAARPA